MKMDILETTLRDGSYAIDFQFTAADTAAIAVALESAGFRMIEIGHGVGLHGSECGHGQASETDKDYLLAAARSLRKAKFGMFCIPGIARLEDIDMAADHGMGFIRIGTNVTDVRDSEKFICRAKKHGMFVAANFMKSYTLKPAEFAVNAKQSYDYGVDILYIVDSSGGMLPKELESYFYAVRDVCDVPLGFHGHNNLGLAVVNSLRAVELGATLVDSSLQGLGRSAGNAPTEQLLAVLKRSGYDLPMDLLATFDAGEKYVRPLLRRAGMTSLDVVSGYSHFHSSYMSKIRHFSTFYQVDPRRLIMSLCEVDQVNAPDELIEKIAKRLQRTTNEVTTARFKFDEYFGSEQG